ncbi:hypothetical protein Lalb_Chr09g0322651 [Lupinus albus]|uniref:Uncharacterized protein n=1 Tax=Lupinus albus TaxID=3870 RepID=A0A6A4PZN9_LUPAL|nr:hypothetical protein Lalb_Chr09g0322651 [Lupinus albus]
MPSQSHVGQADSATQVSLSRSVHISGAPDSSHLGQADSVTKANMSRSIHTSGAPESSHLGQADSVRGYLPPKQPIFILYFYLILEYI